MEALPPFVPKAEDAPRWAALNARELPAWFDDVRLGIFVHWGPYSVAGWAEPIGELGAIPNDHTWFTHNPYAEWLHNTIRIDGSPAQAYFRTAFPGAQYDDLLDRWPTPTVDYDALLGAFKSAGAGYVVLTTKHHDGVTLWDAPGTGDRNTVSRGPRADLVGAYGRAARGAGLRFGTYYSGGLDWHVRPFPPHLSGHSVANDRPVDAEYAQYAAAHVRDLVQRYAPDILWNDIEWPDAGKNFGSYGLGSVFEEYYRAVPDGLVNDRWHVAHSDYMTSEYQMFRETEGARPWENCRGIGFSFGYNQNEEAESMDAPAAIRHLIDVTTRGGHLLLGVGPKADGTLPHFQTRVLEGMAKWMQVAGSTIAGLQPVAGVAPVQLRGEGFLRLGTAHGRTYAFVDAVDPLPFVDLDTRAACELLTPEFGNLEHIDGGLRIHLYADRPGAVVLRIH